MAKVKVVIRLGEDGYAEPAGETLRRVLEEIFSPQELERESLGGVNLGYINIGGDWHSRFGGVKLQVRDQDYKAVTKNVRVDTSGMIDGDKVKARLEELKALAAKEKQAKEKRVAENKAALERLETLAKAANITSPDRISGRGDNHFDLTISLSAKQVMQVMSLVGKLREG